MSTQQATTNATTTAANSIQIFKAGRRIAENGTAYDITAADVLECAECYDPTKHEAPLVIGHPKTDDPAWGWAEKLKADNAGELYADFKEVDDGVKGLVNAKRYKKVSASFYPPAHPANPVPGKWYLRHVGLLGAVPPSVKGMGAVSFADSDGCVEFSEYVEERASSLFRRIRDWMIAKFGQDEADRVIPSWEIESMNETIANERAKHGDILNPAFSETTPPVSAGNQPPITITQQIETPSSTPPNPKENPAMEKTQAELDAIARADKAEKELNDLKTAQAKAERATAHKANADFAEGLAKDGKLPPAHKGIVTQVLDFIQYPNDTTADFGEGDDKKPLADAVRSMLSGTKAASIFGEHATADKAGMTHSHSTADFGEASDPDALAHHNRATALAKSEGISYEDAARRTA